MKYTECISGGKAHRLLFNGNAKYRIEEDFGEDFFEKMSPKDSKSYEVLCGAAAIMAEQAELCRRREGYDHEPIVTAEQLRGDTMPSELFGLYQAAAAARAARIRKGG